MAAAALGNTVSDVIGIGSVHYVEMFAQKIGFEAPKLTLGQLNLPRTRIAANVVRDTVLVYFILLFFLLFYFLLFIFLKNHKVLFSEITQNLFFFQCRVGSSVLRLDALLA